MLESLTESLHMRARVVARWPRDAGLAERVCGERNLFFFLRDRSLDSLASRAAAGKGDTFRCWVGRNCASRYTQQGSGTIPVEHILINQVLVPRTTCNQCYYGSHIYDDVVSVTYTDVPLSTFYEMMLCAAGVPHKDMHRFMLAHGLPSSRDAVYGLLEPLPLLSLISTDRRQTIDNSLVPRAAIEALVERFVDEHDLRTKGRAWNEKRKRDRIDWGGE